MSVTPRYHPRLDTSYQGSLSVGIGTKGYLAQGAQLPREGPYHRILPLVQSRGTSYGSDKLVKALLRAGEKVAKRYPGSILNVGNITKGGGGAIYWSFSHNTGLDADIAFYAFDSNGRLYKPDKLFNFRSDGRSTYDDGKYTFNPTELGACEGLITDPNIDLHYIFVSSLLKAKVLEFAQKQEKESPQLIAHASHVLLQPSPKLPHTNHFHVRIYCPKEDILEGCQSKSKHSANYNPWPGELNARIETS